MVSGKDVINRKMSGGRVVVDRAGRERYAAERKNLANAKSLDLVAIGQSGVLPGRELVIERGDLVQAIDNLLVDNRSGIAPSPFCFLPEERRIV